MLQFQHSTKRLRHNDKQLAVSKKQQEVIQSIPTGFRRTSSRSTATDRHVVGWCFPRKYNHRSTRSRFPRSWRFGPTSSLRLEKLVAEICQCQNAGSLPTISGIYFLINSMRKTKTYCTWRRRRLDNYHLVLKLSSSDDPNGRSSTEDVAGRRGEAAVCSAALNELNEQLSKAQGSITFILFVGLWDLLPARSVWLHFLLFFFSLSFLWK